MPSQLTAIYAALASKTVTAAGVTLPVRGLDKPTGALTTASLPIRILHPFGNQTEGRDYHFRGMSNFAKPTWTLVDFCAWRAVGQGVPPTAELVAYMAAYADMLKTFKDAGASVNPAIRATLESARLTPGVFEWPITSEQWYFGVQCQLDITEVMT